MKDRLGFTFAELIEIQDRHLDKWSLLLPIAMFQPVYEYVKKYNREAQNAESEHRVWRGQCLYTIVWNWPEVPAPYPSPSATDADLI
jgi:hypothetical protein